MPGCGPVGDSVCLLASVWAATRAPAIISSVISSIEGVGEWG